MVFVVSVIVAVAAFMAWNRNKRNTQVSQPAIILCVASAVAALFQSMTIIPAGHVGVQDFFGKVSSRSLNAGINMRNPLAHIAKFSIKTQEIKELLDVPSKEGLNVSVEVSILYHLNPEKAAEVYRTVGENFVNVILIPQFRSVVRGVTATYEAKALYTSEREMLSQTILSELDKAVKERGITIEATPMRQIILPARLSQAIEQKLESEQESQRMQFILQKEQQEADRKRIEAQGIADFQKIVTLGINEHLLKWKGIEATEKLAASPNAKIVIVGGKDGLPLILNTEK